MKFNDYLPTAILHQAHLKWKNQCLKIDSNESNPETTILICTDFGASFDLQVNKKDNCATNHHAVVCSFYCLRNWKEVSYDAVDKDGNSLTKKCKVSQCDRWIAFLDPIACRKKNNHIAHNHFLHHIMNHYETNSEVNMSNVICRIIHDDNCRG